jgi:hypothetical protein
MSFCFNVCRRFAFLIFCIGFVFLTNVFALNLPEDAPILISEANSTRAFVTVPNARRGANSSVKIVNPARQNVVTFYLTNVKDLLEDEGATAFRVEFQDANYYRYPLEIVSFERTQERKNVYALSVRVGGIGDLGDVLVRVTWRGMSSNRCRLSVGFEGGRIQDDEGASPTPMPVTDAPTSRTRVENRAFGVSVSALG